MSIRFIYRGSEGGLRVALVCCAAIAGFVIASALLLFVLPAPHTRAHYLMAGTAPTLAGLMLMLAQSQRERSRLRTLTVRRASEA